MSSGDTIGIMDPAFFLNVQKVEQCATGAVYCQIIDAIYPGTVQMGKVNWQAKHDYEYSYNYKILQNAFQKNGIARYVDPTKLMKAKYQDNLEMLQWIKRYYDINQKGQTYDALARRKGQDLYLIQNDGKIGASSGQHMQPKVAKESNKEQIQPNIPKKQPLSSNLNLHNKQSNLNTTSTTVTDIKSEVLQQQVEELKQKNDEYEQKIQMLEMRSAEIDNERQMYFQKLSKLDEFITACQQMPESQESPFTVELIQQIQSILMAEDVNNMNGNAQQQHEDGEQMELN